MSKTKSFSTETSDRYSLALFEISKENSELNTVENDIKIFLKVLKDSKDFFNFINNPTILKQEQGDGIKKISERMKFANTFKNFLLLLTEKRRIFFVERILNSFLKLVERNRGEVKAYLTSAKELNEVEIKKISTELSTILNSSINFKYILDKNLIGGIKIQVGSLMIDSTIKSKLRKYENKMMEN